MKSIKPVGVIACKSPRGRTLVDIGRGDYRMRDEAGVDAARHPTFEEVHLIMNNPSMLDFIDFSWPGSEGAKP